MQFFVAFVILGAVANAQLNPPITTNVIEKPCPEAQSDAVKCFVSNTDSTIRGDLRLLTGVRKVDVDKMAKCVKTNANRCLSKASSGAANIMAFLQTHEAEIRECVQEVLPKVKSDMEKCVQEKYEWFKMPAMHPDQASGMNSEHPGVNYMVLDYIIKEYSGKCKTLANCRPPNYKKIRSELCKHQHNCFDKTEERCGSTKEDLRQTVCECWQNLPNKDQALDQMSTCIATKAGMPAQFSNFMKKFFANAVDKNVCNMDMDAYFEQCSDETTSSTSSSSSPVDMLSSFGGSGGSFGNFGNFGK